MKLISNFFQNSFLLSCQFLDGIIENSLDLLFQRFKRIRISENDLLDFRDCELVAEFMRRLAVAILVIADECFAGAVLAGTCDQGLIAL
jgi:hypothetical protein